MVCSRTAWEVSRAAAVVACAPVADTLINRSSSLAFCSRKSSDDGETASINVRREFFVGGDKDLPWFILKRTDQFTFGYVLTVHKAQGSQWDNVVLFDESHVFRDSARNWLYTGITRAASNLTVVM